MAITNHGDDWISGVWVHRESGQRYTYGAIFDTALERQWSAKVYQGETLVARYSGRLYAAPFNGDSLVHTVAAQVEASIRRLGAVEA